MKNRIFIVFAVVILFLLLSQASAEPHHTQAVGPYNIVFILTDDQRWDTLCTGLTGMAGPCSGPVDTHPMPAVENELLAKGTAFPNTFVSVPLCCPSRSSLLSGGFYAQHTNVLANSMPNGGFPQFSDSTSLGTILQQNGYKTALIGKYLNEYNDVVKDRSFYVPPGWDLWVGRSQITDWNNDYQHIVGSSTYDHSSTGTVVNTRDGTYIMDYERDQALTFIDGDCVYQSCTKPFFLYLATSAPHDPATPAPRHVGLFANNLYRERGYGEQPDGDLSDKPTYVRTQGRGYDPAVQDPLHENMLESLRAIDEAFNAILDDLTQKDLLGNTVFVFASDNGYMWGEHWLQGKYVPYEESIRVPLIIRMPNAQPATLNNLVAEDLDMGPTVLELAGVTPLASDGMSLVPLLTDPSTPWRDSLLIQGGFSLDGSIPPWAGIRTADNWKYVEYGTGEKELYDLATGSDPYELSSKDKDPAYQTIMADLANRLALLNRGLAIKSDNLPEPNTNALPDASTGVDYSFQFAAWGGNGTYVWSLFNGVTTPPNQCNGALPPGLVLDPSGSLHGIPLSEGIFSFCIRVQDTSISPQPGNGRPQSHIKLLTLTVSSTTGTLQGTTSDALTGSPLAGVTVTTGSYSDISSGVGFYQITGVPAGSYDVTASASGYLSSTVPGVSISPGATTTLDLALTPAGCVQSCSRSAGIDMRSTSSIVKGLVTVQDENGAALQGALVSATWTLPDGSTSSSSRNTNASGVATFKTGVIGTGTYTITITDIAKTGYTFDPAHSVLSASIVK